jgi:hypothetical protein
MADKQHAIPRRRMAVELLGTVVAGVGGQDDGNGGRHLAFHVNISAMNRPPPAAA